jgi:hypothetical protein
VNAEEFVKGLQLVVYRRVVEDVPRIMANPPGRRPREELVQLSSWFNSLGDEDKERVKGVVRLTADHAVFDVLAVLDGVRMLDDNHTELHLRTGDGVLLNEDHELHEIFRSVVDKEIGFSA